MTMITRLYIVLISITYLGLGVVAFFNPAGTVEPLDIVMPTAQSLTEIRATYGGLMFGVGLFLLFTSTNKPMLKTGLVAIVCTSISIAFTRTYGLVVDETRESLQYLLLGIETVSGLLALVFWLKQTR